MPNVRGGAVWWDGYHSQDTVIIEEFSGWMRIQFVLRLFDRYPMQVQPKSGSVTFVAKKIIVTSNYPPSVWWRNIGLGLPMVRRLTPPIGTVEYIGNAEYPTAAEYLAANNWPEDPLAPEIPRRVEGEAAPPNFNNN
jgi:hypothetical protein